MGKIFSGNIDPNSTNIPTTQTNQDLYGDIQDRSNQMLDQQTEDYLKQQQQQQYGDIGLATATPEDLSAQQDFGGVASAPEQQFAEEVETPGMQDIHLNWLGQAQESFLKGVGETVIGSTGDVLNFVGSAIPGFSMLEGNVLGNALRDYGDKMGEDHTSFLAKKLQGQELTWASLADKNFWSVNIAEMIPMALEFWATGGTAAAASETGLQWFTKKALTTEARLARATQTATDIAEGLATGTKTAKDVLGTGKGIAGKLFRNVDNELELTRLSREFSKATGAGISNNMLAGMQNGMDEHRKMQEANKLAISQGKEPLYTEDEMAEVATGTYLHSMWYAPIDMLSWGVTYGKATEKIMAGMSKKIALRPSEALIKASAQSFGKTMAPIAKGVAKFSGHVLAEGIEESLQETFEEWSKLKSREKYLGEKAPSYWEFYNSKGNQNTIILSAAMGGFMGGALNFRESFKNNSEKALNYADRNEVLRASIDAFDKGGQEAKEYHINNQMIDLLHDNKGDLFDNFMTSLVANKTVSEEEAVEYKNTFDAVQADYDASTNLNVAGKYALAQNTVRARSLSTIMENRQKAYDQQVAELYDQYGIVEEEQLALPSGQKLLGEQKTLGDGTSTMTPAVIETQEETAPKAQKKTVPAEIQAKLDKMEREHIESTKAIALNLALANQNRLNLISGKAAKPLNISFVKTKTGTEVPFINDKKSYTVTDASEIAPEEMEEHYNNSGIVAGLSEKQYQNFVEMTDEEVYEMAKQNRIDFLRHAPNSVKDLYRKSVEALSGAMAKAKETFNPKQEETPATEAQEEQPTEEQVTEPGTELVPVPSEVAPVSPAERNVEDENAYEREAIEAPEETTKRKTLREVEAERIAEAERRFLEEEGGAPSEVAKDAFTVDKNPDTGKYRVKLADGSYHPKEFTTVATANKVADRLQYEHTKPMGNASLATDVLSGAYKAAKFGVKGAFGLAKGGISLGRGLFSQGKQAVEQTAEQIETAYNELEKRKAVKQNMEQDALRRKIIHNSYYTSGVRNTLNNPTKTVTKNELDEYLDSSIADFKWGPTATEQQIVINRILKKKGINVDVIAAQNLFSAVGIPAVGYALGATIFIDDKVWNQDAIFMHEMSHIYYRTAKDRPETLEAVKFARNNDKLVNDVERKYFKDIKYNFNDEHYSLNQIVDMFYPDMDTRKEEMYQDLSMHPALKGLTIDQLNINDLYHLFADQPQMVRSADEFQDVINEELFAFTLEGPLSKSFNKALEPTKERRRQVIAKGWWSWLKGERVTYEQPASDIVEKLNQGKAVRKDDLFNHIMDGFSNSISKQAISSSGYASLVDMNEKEAKANQERITQAKITERETYNPEEAKRQNRDTTYKRLADAIRKEVGEKMADYSETERRNEIEAQLEELEYGMMEEGAFEDYDLAKAVVFKGATRILNGFVKSLNYVKRQRFMLSPEAGQTKFDESSLLDRDELISALYNLAFETKGNVNNFISAIENSDIEEIYQFNRYMDKTKEGRKNMYLASLGHVMANSQTISSIRNVVSKDGSFETINALSETEMNKVQSHLDYLADQSRQHYAAVRYGQQMPENYNRFLESYKAIERKRQTGQDYLNVLKMLAPYGTKYSELINNKSINIRGKNVNVKELIDQLVASKIAINKKNGQINVYGLKPFVDAIVDSNRKYTSYSVVKNAEGNMEPSKITNNHLLSELNGMMDFLTPKKGSITMPSFKKFKEKYAHASDPSKRTHENTVLRHIYDNVKNKISYPTISQYLGLSHLQSGNDSLYKNSTAYTQSIEDFMLFANPKRPNTPSYQQTLSAFADSPRKFTMEAPRLVKDLYFSGTELNKAGERLLEHSFAIYENSNKHLPENKREGTIKTFDQFKAEFYKSVEAEKKIWNENARDLIANKTVKPSYFANGKLSTEGENKITEFVFNQVVNGMAMAEIFNPGIPFNDIIKRNKGNTSPVITFGNPNLKMEAIPINDTGIKRGTDSGMYMTDTMAKKIIDASLGVMDLNNGLKLLNYHVEKNNPNFKGTAAYFKGYTTIISEETLVTEPGLRGIYELLKEREDKYNAEYFDKYGKSPSLDITNGDHNYINYAVPYSAIKSDFFTDEHKKALSGLTYENLNNHYQEHLNKSVTDYDTVTEFDKIGKVLDSLYYGPEGFMGLSTDNFGPQQVMDKETKQSTTPVQFISALIVNGDTQGTLGSAEQIQSLIRKDMKSNLDQTLNELNNMNPKDYKNFILKNLDLENMDQSQRLLIEENLTNLSHPAIADFITNTLANRLKQEGNKLKTNGTIAQQKPSVHYRYRDGISINGRNTIAGYEDRVNEDGSVGSNIMEIVLPAHMRHSASNPSGVKPRAYYTLESTEFLADLAKSAERARQYQLATDQERMDMLKEFAMFTARNKFKKSDNPNGYGGKVSDYVGSFQKGGSSEVAGYFVRGDSVLATRIPSHGPSSTGVFEAIDFLEGKGNQTIVSEQFSEVVGSDYDGDSLFIQAKGKDTPNFNESLDKTVSLWTSPEMKEQIRSSIDFKSKVERVIKSKEGKTIDMPMSPSYHRNAYNNTMISKRNIGIIFNTHRMANYLAAYNVKINEPITIDGKRVEEFSDDQVGQNSRNNESAMLANIILDNASYQYADKLGLNDQTINQFSLLTNMGFSLDKIHAIMNSNAVKSWNKFKSNNASPYLTKLKAKDIRSKIFSELGTDAQESASLTIDTSKDKINTPQNSRNIIHLMESLEAMNNDILKVSKIMAGHKGVENNPFILERQLQDFEDVTHSKGEKPLLLFNEGFRNNPDIKGYHDTAKTILEVLKKANNIYNDSTSELMDSLNTKIGFDNKMTTKQLERASKVIKAFNTSRILGLNNIPSNEKIDIKNKVLQDIMDYRTALLNTKTNPKDKMTAFDKSMLFQRALNIRIKKNKDGGFTEDSYVSANPRFFNESLVEQERDQVQKEFNELPKEIKDGLLTLDLMSNSLTGPLSLSNVFDKQMNHDISTYATHQQRTKNKPINKEVLAKLENLIITNELNSPESNIRNITALPGKPKLQSGDKVLNFVYKNDKPLYNALNMGKPMFFKIDGKPFFYAGLDKNQRKSLKFTSTDPDSYNRAINSFIESQIKPYEDFKGDVNLEAISIADNDDKKPIYKTRESKGYDKKVDHIIETNIEFDSKKKVDTGLSGSASLIDFHNYNEVRPLSQKEYDVVMEFDKAVSPAQREELYNQYLSDKADANKLTNDINETTVKDFSTEDLNRLYQKYAKKDVYAYSVVTTPMIMEIANRNSVEQSAITGVFESGQDISLMDSYFNNNNITSKHPATQSLVRKINSEYKKFIHERSKYLKEINDITDRLYKEKFKLSEYKSVRFLQRAYQSLFQNRADIYNKLYGNIVETVITKLPNGTERKEFKFKPQEEINALYKNKQITKTEYDFYNKFRDTTNHLLKFDESGKKRRDYIPHTSMNAMEMFANRGLLGVFVNSKGYDTAIEDVKVYTDVSGQRELMTFRDAQSHYNVIAAAGKSSLNNIKEYELLKLKAKKQYKLGTNEDGTAIVFSNMQNATLMDMSPMSRFSNSRSMKAELMPSMDLNKALNEYVHAALFTNGNENFGGFKAMMPLVDGVMAYNDKNGYKNAYNYVKEVVKEGFIMKKDQITFGKNTDAVINGLIRGNTFYALGYKGFLIGKGLYAIGNLAIGKYMNIKREGGKAWAKGEARYWGLDKGFSLDNLHRRERAKTILRNLGYEEIQLYDDVAVEKKSGLDNIFSKLSLLPMSVTEDWIQKVHMLGMLTDEEFEKFDEKGNYKVGETQIANERILALDERVKSAHGKGYTPTDQSRIHKYALGRMFMQFSRHIPTQIRERFAKEDVDMNGNKYIGSLRQVGKTASDIFHNGMSPAKFKEYRASLQPHEREALDAGLKGMAMMTVLGFVASDSESQMQSAHSGGDIAGGVMSDANSHFDMDKMTGKLIPPVIRSGLSITKAFYGGPEKEN